MQNAQKEPGTQEDPKIYQSNLLQDIILKITKICVGELSYFESISSKVVVMSVYDFLEVIDNSLNLCVNSCEFSLVLTSSHPLGVS